MNKKQLVSLFLFFFFFSSGMISQGQTKVKVLTVKRPDTSLHAPNNLFFSVKEIMNIIGEQKASFEKAIAKGISVLI